MWLSASNLVYSDSGDTPAQDGSAVMHWKSRVGNGNEATASSSNRAPIFIQNAHNDKSAVYFDGLNDGTGDYMQGSLSLTKSKSFVVIFEDTGSGSGCCRSIINTGPSGEFNGIAIFDNRVSVDYNNNDQITDVNPLNQILIITATFDESGDVKLYVNGELKHSQSTSFIGIPTMFEIGGREPNSFLNRFVDIVSNQIYLNWIDFFFLYRHVKGNLYELLMFTGVLSDEERQFIESSLAYEYNIEVNSGNDSNSIILFYFIILIELFGLNQ